MALRFKRIKIDHPKIRYYQVEYFSNYYAEVRVNRVGSSKVINYTVNLYGDENKYHSISYDIGDEVKVLFDKEGTPILAKWIDDKDYFWEIDLIKRQYNNDLWFEPNLYTSEFNLLRYIDRDKLKISGYNDSYWWTKVAPANNTIVVNGIKFVYDFYHDKIRVYQGEVTSD